MEIYKKSQILSSLSDEQKLSHQSTHLLLELYRCDRETLNVPPILILDDVLAELDLTRQNLLLNSVGKNSQCFISATHLDKFNQSFLGSSQMIHL